MLQYRYSKGELKMNSDILLLKIRGLIPSLNPALQKIAGYILENPHSIKLLRIRELAEKCGVAEATITRFVKSIGFKNFQEFKINLAEITSEKLESSEFVYDEVTKGDSIESIIEKIVYINNQALQDTKKILDVPDLERAIAAIERARNIDIYGAGGSFVAAENAQMRFYRIGQRCMVYNDPNQQAVSASLLTKEDVALGISNSGRTISTVSALKTAKEHGATTICITNFDQSPITVHADIKLFTSTRDSTFFQESMVSRIAQMLIIDILYAGLAVKNIASSVKMIEKSAESLRHMFL
jgi:RpiR family carbohydrate utilization transcriptional regulator